MLTRLIKRFYQDENGQGITEYGAILAFVSLLVVLVFSFANGTLALSLQQCSSSMIAQLNRLNDAVIAANGT